MTPGDLSALFDLANKASALGILLVSTVVLWRALQACNAEHIAAKVTEKIATDVADKVATIITTKAVVDAIKAAVMNSEIKP